MPDFEKLLNNNSERKILTLFLPGLIASWYTALRLILYFKLIVKNDKIWQLLLKENIILSIILSFGLLVAIYGIGHIIEKLATRLEFCLDNKCIKKHFITNSNNQQNNDDNEFMKIWYMYLQQTFEIQPIAIGYYSYFITRYKTELSCIIALIIQFIFLLLDYIFFHKIPLFISTTILIFTYFTIIYLYWEAQASVLTAHNIRKKIVAIKNSRIVTIIENETILAIARRLRTRKRFLHSYTFGSLKISFHKIQ